ncbi:hypothetical protein SS1G_01807 [Sclerotinia sclerotiorum 1980 UF-70]|uniref:Uncharacterized protein n=1 Tax=Sclerotinia sclerotiorum (strain ATCC 18683 / 1980 / Ss-1) TaxID=665079 RepID=A7E927_SCLS1|nr:hypothetical protein SS1G_01807 [Sclerotinia sclerotiorum 1980 UF-70]EDN96879.1 hypothetical protein SS1G_01807 [Sclerotinia sclerotiorum 1980 UF-70]
MTQSNCEPIAIVGVSCRFPAGANSPEELWSLISQGKSAWSDVPADRFNWKSFLHPSPDVVGTINSRGGHFIDQDIRTFDAGFFGIPPAEANAMDPQHRLQLETTYEALENAGIPIEAIRGSSTSVFIALFNKDYDRMMFKDTNDIAKYHLLGSGEAIVSNRISYTFDLKGPSMTLDTGCSGSLVALHQACQGLRSGDTDMALVGGTSLILSPDSMIPMSRIGVLDPSGKSFVFDDRGAGYGRGEGVSTIVLKRLQDAVEAGDHVRAIIRNTGINQDGKTAGITLPSQTAQQALINQVFKQVGLEPRSISYVEAHGTGTVAGDLAETKTIANVFCAERKEPLFVGSIKSNLGHLESASGTAGLLKAIKILEKGLIPPNVNLRNYKKGLNLGQSNILVPLKLENLPIDKDGKARVAINSFGYGGTNAHAILESSTMMSPTADTVAHGAIANPILPLGTEPEQTQTPSALGVLTSAKLFLLSAKSKTSLIGAIEKLRSWAMISKTKSSNNQFENLSYTLNQRRSVFQWRSSIVAANLEELIAKSDQAICKATKASTNVRVAFIFTGQGAQWASMGREFIVSGISKKTLAMKGAMLAVGLGEDKVKPFIQTLSSGKVVIACSNSPTSTTISGDEAAILELQRTLENRSIFTRKLNVDTAYHSHHMEVVASQYLNMLAGLAHNDADYNILTQYWHESRLSLEHRLRDNPYHDLLGVRVVGGTPYNPHWRHLVSIDTLPWLSEHVVDGSAIFPGAGYLCMAIEATRELAREQKRHYGTIVRYILRNISFSKPLTIPCSPNRVELQLGLNLGKNKNERALMDWIEFGVSSYQQGIWKQHCSGAIKLEFSAPMDEVDQLREADFIALSVEEMLKECTEGSTKLIKSSDFYEKIKSLGNSYGPNFASIRELMVGEFHATAKVSTPAISECMPSHFMQPHVVHPATLDAIFQTALPLCLNHCVNGPVMPIYIDQFTVESNISAAPGQEFRVATKLDPTGPRSAITNSLAFQSGLDNESRCVVTLSNGELKGLGDFRHKGTIERTSIRNFTHTIQWNVDIDFMTTSLFKQYMGPVSNELRMQKRRAAIDKVAALYIRDFLNGTKTIGSTCPKHYTLLLQWMYKYTKTEHYHEIISKSLGQDVDSILSEARTGIEGDFLRHLGGRLEQIMSGISDPLSLMLEQNRLERYYANEWLSRASLHLVKYLELLSFRQPNLVVLEIGAGTGGTTLPILQQLGNPNNFTFKSYDYTDISSGFFEAARSKFQNWSDLLVYKTLNIEIDPLGQGFEEASYDLIIASNVLHATKCITKTLDNVRKLLKPGGKLALIEITRFSPMDNITFGLLPGWWAGINDGRQDTPILSVSEWNDVLLRASFSGVEVSATDFEGPAGSCDLIVSAYNPTSGDLKYEIKILVGAALSGAESPSKNIQSFASDAFLHFQKQGLTTSFSSWSQPEPEDSGLYLVIDCSDNPLLVNPSQETFRKITRLATQGARILWVSIPKDSDNFSANAETSLISGFARVARMENERLKFSTLDVQQAYSSQKTAILTIISEIIMRLGAVNKYPEESDYIFRDDQIYIPRLIPNDFLNAVVTSHTYNPQFELGEFRQLDRALKLHVEAPGLLDTMVFRDDELKDSPLRDDEVEIQVKACGVNFKDVFVALGQMKATDHMVGECSGIISSVGAGLRHRFKVGDRVWSLAATPYANFARSLGCTVYQIPDSMSFLTAASIPVVFTTAYYCLVNVAKLIKGQTVLIHAASGGVGQAAVMIAKSIGAEIIATVGSVSKSEMLVERYKIPQSHIFSSRSLNFRSGIHRLTGGRGVDVVLNSLAGEAMQETWQCIAPMGTFVEIGKSGIYQRQNVSLEPFERNVTFASVDMTLVVKYQPEKLLPIFEKLMEMFNNTDISPVYPIMEMPIGHIEQAFRLIQARKHMGKIVLDTDTSNLITVASPGRTTLCLDCDGTYLIAGGLGGIGRVIAKFLVDRGAKHILILSRTSHEERSKPLMTEIESLGAHFRIITCDISNKKDCLKAITIARETMPSIQGVIQAAMVLQDRTLEKMGVDDYRAAVNPKVSGTQNLLHCLNIDHLNFFVILSSCSTILGNTAQANYSAACSFQDAVAQLHGQASSTSRISSLNLGMIEGTESLEKVSDNAMKLIRQVCVPVKIEEFLSLLEFSMRPEAREPQFAQIAIGIDRESVSNRKGVELQQIFSHLPVCASGVQSTPLVATRSIEEELSTAQSFNQVQSIVTTAISKKLCALVASDFSDIDINASMENLGLDSLIAIELKNWINRSFHSTLQTSDILDAPNLYSLGQNVCEKSDLVMKHRKLKAGEDGTNDGHEDAVVEILSGTTGLPRLPLPELESTLSFYETSVKALCSERELQQLRTAIIEFQEPGSIGTKLQDRLRERQNNPHLECWLSDLYCKHVYLRNRPSISPHENFMAVHAQSKMQHGQAKRAAIVTLAAMKFKDDFEAHKVQPVLLNDQPICMDALNWLFNAIREPCLMVDRMKKYPSQDYIAVLRRGRIYKIIIRDSTGQRVDIYKLEEIFQIIIDLGAVKPPRKSIAGMTADRRDSWAKMRKMIRSGPLNNSTTIDMVENSAFVFIVCTNGESGHIFEHSMIDALPISRFDASIRKAILSHDESSYELTRGQNGVNDETHSHGAGHVDGTNEVKNSDSQEWYKEYQYITNAELDLHLANIKEEYEKSYSPSETESFTGNHFGTLYLRSHNVPPKSGYQVIIQLASLMYFGYHPPSFQTISMGLFNKGRVELIQSVLPEILAFTQSAFNEALPIPERRELFIKAAKTHAATMIKISRGHGFATHLYALREVLRDGEEVPTLFNLSLYSRIRPGKLLTDNANRRGIIREMAITMPDPENVLLHYEVHDQKCDFSIKAPPGKSMVFFQAIEKATVLVRRLLGDPSRV